MTDLAKLGIKVEYEDIAGAVKEMKRLESQSKRNEKEAKDLTRETKKAAKATDKMRGSASALKGALATIGIGLLVRNVVMATTKMQAIESAMRVAAGSAEEAADMMAFVREESDRLGLSLGSAAKEFSSLAVAAKGTALEGKGAREIFVAVSEASTALGLSADEAGGALNAIQQMISKGTVSAEELRGQLGERLPGAFQMAARSMNMTTQELGKALQSGEVMAEDMLPRLARELHNTFGSQAIERAGSLQAEMNRLSTAFTDLMAQDGMPAATSAMREFTELLGREDIKDGFDKMIAGLSTLAVWLVKATGLFVSFGEGIGEFFGRIATGEYYIRDLNKATKSLTDQTKEHNVALENSKTKLADLEAQYATLGNVVATQTKIFGEDHEGVSVLKDRQAELATQISATKDRIKEQTAALVELKEEAAKAPPEAPTATDELFVGPLLDPLDGEDEDRDPLSVAEDIAMNKEELEKAHLERMQQLAIEHTGKMMELNDRMREYERARDAEEKARREQAQAQFFDDLISLTSSKSKTLFKIGQAVSIATAAVQGYESAVAAWKNGMIAGGPFGGPALAAAYAGASLLKTGALILSMKSATVGGGGGSSSAGGGGTPAPAATSAPPPDVPTQRHSASITVSGGLHDDESVRKLIEKMNEVYEDMGGNVSFVTG